MKSVESDNAIVAYRKKMMGNIDQVVGLYCAVVHMLYTHSVNVT
jgi:hypothetical protein